MFGLEEQKKKKPTTEFIFELEKELKDPAENRRIKELIEGRVQKLKSSLLSGDEKDEFDRFGLLLHGYNAFLKVIARVTGKGKGK